LDAARRQSLFGSITTGALFPSSSPTRFARRSLANAPPDRRRTRERDQRDVGMIDQRVADVTAAARDHTQPRRGQPTLVEQEVGQLDRPRTASGWPA